MMQSIANLVKGTDQNKLHFYENDGPQKFLKYLTEPHYIDNMKFTELCMQTLKNVTEFKATVRSLLRDDGVEMLKKVIPKCFEMTEGWIDEAR